MNRRKFHQTVALGAGSLPFLADDEQAVAAVEPTQPNEAQGNGDGQENAVDKSVPAPVNVADFERAAKSKLTKATFDYISTGSADGHTLQDNVAAYQRIRVLPPLLKGTAETNLSTTVLGQNISMPIMLAPVAVQRMFHADGALASAKAAHAAGTLFGVSSSAGNSIEEIARAADGPKWYQLYVPKDRDVAQRLVQRAERAGYKAIILTVDLGEWKDADKRNQFMLPKAMLLKHLRDIGFPVTDKMNYRQLVDFNAKAWDLAMTWDVFNWLRKTTKLPLLIKGVLRESDAKKAVEMGVDGIVVSNHGGRRLDGMPATIDVLPGIVDAVGTKAEVYIDGGIRRGTDVLKALALGAKAVLVGRPYAWALAANGERGVRDVLEVLRAELTNAMLACGCGKLDEVDRSLLG